MTDLIKRLEETTGPDRKLDFVIMLVADGKDPTEYKLNGQFADEVPRYTSSLDAALTLVPEGATVEMHLTEKDSYAYVNVLEKVETTDGDEFVETPHSGNARTLPIALCIAALRARGVK